ncbi:hypothetical protein B0H19DRAFT_1276482 [Mycena capillaripes]|nr:hypothetical protein B0H19DRAFT_1276482 [Mycena capillaripes]
MTPDEIKTLRSIGLSLVEDFAAISNETILLTVYGVLVLKAIFVLLGKGGRKRSTMLTLLAILVLFALSIVLWALDMTDFIMEVKLSLIDDPDLPIGARFDNASASIFPKIAAIDGLYSYMSLIGDGIIIWRVWNLRSYYWSWVILIPVALLFGSLVATLMLTYCVAALGSEIVTGTFQKPVFCRNVQTATYATVCATTATATILIAHTTWSFRKTIKPMLGGHIGALTSAGTTRRRRSPVENVLLLLVESGVLYFLFFAVQVVSDVPRVHDWAQTQPGVSFALTMYCYCSSVIVGLYPTAVVVLAHLQNSVLDDAALSVNSALQIGQVPADGSDTSPPTLQLSTKRKVETNTDNVRAKPVVPSRFFGLNRDSRM